MRLLEITRRPLFKSNSTPGKAFKLFGAGILGLCLISGCASKKEKDGAEKVSTEQQLYETAQTSLDNSNWLSAIRSLQLLEEHFPFGTYGEQAQLELIYAHFESGEYEAAIATAERFIRLHPQHRDVDYAYYLRGLASFNNESGFLGAFMSIDNTNKDLGSARDAYDQFLIFINRYPNSAYAPDAQQRMVYLRNILARYEIHAANYYFKRGAYLAAANRGKYVVENFQEAPAVPDGLAVMAQAYYLLGKDALGDSATKVLASNYANHPALKADGTFNKKFAERQRDRSLVNYLTFGLFSKDEIVGFDTREVFNPQYHALADAQKKSSPTPP